MSKPKKAVIYTRFSPRRNAKDCESIEKQLDFCRNYCNFQQWDIIGEHDDRALSGAKCDNRPGLESALVQAVRHKAVLVVYSLSRLSRSTKDAITISERLSKGKADLSSVTQNIDTTTAMGSAFFQFMAVFAELERKQISERTRDAMKFHQSQGRKMSKIPPYGWQDDPENSARMLPLESERVVIDRIIELKNSGFSLRKIARTLTEEKFVPRKARVRFKGEYIHVNGRWHHGLVRNILNRVDPERLAEND